MTYKSYKQRLNIKLGLPQDTEHTLKELKVQQEYLLRY